MKNIITLGNTPEYKLSVGMIRVTNGIILKIMTNYWQVHCKWFDRKRYTIFCGVVGAG